MNVEDDDLSDSVFWGVDLRRSVFRDADLSGSTFFHTEWNEVSIDGLIDALVINGVDVTDYVNAHDRWYPLRTLLVPATPPQVLAAWEALALEWETLLGRVADRRELLDHRVAGEWSLQQTLRHLVFAMDKWFMLPILGRAVFTPWGLANTGSQDFEWPGIVRYASVSFEDVCAVRDAQSVAFVEYVSSMDVDDLATTVEVLENGTVTTTMCVHAVLEENFEHLRYMIRDLTAAGLDV